MCPSIVVGAIQRHMNHSDWADYGIDSTCGNFVHYKGADAPCADEALF